MANENSKEAPTQSEQLREPEKAEYVASEEGTFRAVHDGRNGRTLVKIANFTARITEEVIYDDGLETARFYTIYGRGKEDFAPIQVPAEQFHSMNWVQKNWGARAMICAGHATKDHMRAAIQSLSTDIKSRRVYTHLGWRKDEQGRYAYIHGGGAIGKGAENTTCEPVHELSRYKLPAPPTGESLTNAIRASLSLLEIGPANMMYPLLAAVYSAPLGEVQPNDFAVWVHGETGSRKSTVAAVLLSHFGDFSRNTLPASFLATANGNEVLAFCGKDALLVFDDYVPGQTAQDAGVNRLLRGIGDNHGRLRATASGNTRPEKPPRCLPLVTAELSPPGIQSSAARTLLVRWEKDTLDLERLAQAESERGGLALCMAGFLDSLAFRLNRNPEEFRIQLAEAMTRNRNRLALRTELYAAHGRVIETAAKLLAAFSLFLLFAVEKHAITQAECAKHLSGAESALVYCAKQTEDFQREEKPVTLFLETLQALFRQGKIFLQPMRKDMPREKLIPWGWYNPGTTEIAPKKDADCVGWYDYKKGAVYLLPTETYKAVYEYARKAGKAFPASQKSLGDSLISEGMIIHHDTDRSTTRISVNGKQFRVWTLQEDHQADWKEPSI